MTKSILTIVRGLPGSGKSAYARKLAAETGAMLIEPDALLVRGGVYWYTPERYAEAKKWSFELVIDTADCGGADVVYADVLPKKEDVQGIISQYKYGNYNVQVTVIDMPLLTVDESMARNRHNVRREDIERMAREWQPWEVTK